jgi:hypothetical protein
MRLADVQAVVRIGKQENFDKWRTRIGRKRWEHRVRTGDHIGVWVWSPGWFTSYAILTGATEAGMSADSDLQLRLRQIRVENTELDLQERRDKLADRKGQRITLAQADELFRHLLGAIGRFANGPTLTDEQKFLMKQAIDESRDEYARMEHERQQKNTVPGSPPGDGIHAGLRESADHPGGSETPRRRAKSGRPGRTPARA